MEDVERSFCLQASYFGFNYARPLPPSTVMVGALSNAANPSHPPLQLAPALLAHLDAAPGPAGFVSFGSLAVLSAQDITVVADALEHSQLTFVWRLKAAARVVARERLARLSSRVLLLDWTETPQQAQILSHAKVRVFVSHCGSSIMDALAFGKPVVCVPMFADQEHAAMHLVSANAGAFVSRETLAASSANSVQALAEAVLRVAQEPLFAQNAERLQTLNSLAGGVPRAADWIEFAARHGTSFLTVRDVGFHWFLRHNFDVLIVWAAALTAVAWTIPLPQALRVAPVQNERHGVQTKDAVIGDYYTPASLLCTMGLRIAGINRFQAAVPEKRVCWSALELARGARQAEREQRQRGGSGTCKPAETAAPVRDALMIGGSRLDAPAESP
jgi:hypothetical protein